MADRPRFGPAGVPPGFKALKATLMDVPRLLREEGLDAFEYQAVRWGAKPQIEKKDAEKFGVKAKENDVLLSLHASYFINFCGDKETIEASKARLVACATAAHWMQAQTVVFHPGFYGKKTPREAFASCFEALKDVVEKLKTLGVSHVKLGPETMGKPSQLGSLEEVLALCEKVEQAQPVIDWAHLHAREKGLFKTIEDFRRVVENIEKRLGTESVKNMHCHFTKVEFTEKGEKCHHTMDETGYGPDFPLLAKVIAEFKLNPVIISESPVLDVDAIKMREILIKELKGG
ncbi:MAG: TIM barrel protein [Candidatus Bathyarchaeota archaeon]|nr:TIM barrel protein [Candidatus Bathyarchaeota archaeon]MDW8039850.1 TIM barrel protein [Nitrososphaerota archaeon]